MKVSDKIALLKSGVKIAEIAELEKEELLELEQEQVNLDQELEQTLKDDEYKDNNPEDLNEEEAEKSIPELEEIKSQLDSLSSENKKLKEYIAKVNGLGNPNSKPQEPEVKKTGVDVFNELFNKEVK